jgi:hypothetical protein
MARRRRQCKKCPWKTSTDPRTIPGGYDADAHGRLSNTIATGAPDFDLALPLRLMACHATPTGRERPCVGWLDHQLNHGNNIMLRLFARSGRVDVDYELDGPQHESFEDTLPK